MVLISGIIRAGVTAASDLTRTRDGNRTTVRDLNVKFKRREGGEAERLGALFSERAQVDFKYPSR